MYPFYYLSLLNFVRTYFALNTESINRWSSFLSGAKNFYRQNEEDRRFWRGWEVSFWEFLRIFCGFVFVPHPIVGEALHTAAGVRNFEIRTRVLKIGFKFRWFVRAKV